MDRRTFLRTGAAGIGLGLAGCASSRSWRNGTPESTARRLANLPLIEASWDRVIRTTVGLRPHRDPGFVLKADQLDAKMLVHNYGHGGAGMSISWGTGQMAAELALQHTDRRAAVIGSGAVGLTTARQLQRRGFEVTIYAMSTPPDTTSNMSLAGFTPTSGLVENDRRTPEWDAQFRRAAEISYTQLQLMVGSSYGVSWIYQYSPSEQIPGEGGQRGGQRGGQNSLLPAQLRTGQVVLQPGEHPFPTRYATRSPSMRIEPSIYLDALVRDFLMFGGRIVIRKFDTPRDLMSLNESIIVNCTGLGSLALFGDQELVPLKGQLTHFIPQPEVDYQTNGALPGNAAQGGFVHMMPRRDGIALGGTSERGVWSLEPNEEARKRIVDSHIRLFSSMRAPIQTHQITRAEPSRIEPPPLEAFFDVEF